MKLNCALMSEISKGSRRLRWCKEMTEPARLWKINCGKNLRWICQRFFRHLLILILAKVAVKVLTYLGIYTIAMNTWNWSNLYIKNGVLFKITSVIISAKPSEKLRQHMPSFGCILVVRPKKYFFRNKTSGKLSQ